MTQDHEYELYGYLVYETKFGGHWNFHPKDELPAGNFLAHRDHTPVYTRKPKVECENLVTCQECGGSGRVDAREVTTREDAVLRCALVRAGKVISDGAESKP